MSIDPGGCAQKIADIHGAAGVAWLDRLPSIIAGCSQRWSLTILPPFADLSYNYVAPAICQDGARLVVKAGVPHPELSREIAALACFDGRGAVRLLDADPEEGILLLEWLEPGTPLSDLDDDKEATGIAARLMRSLWKPAPAEHRFATLAGWAAGLGRLRARFQGGCGPFPVALVDKAERLLEQLIGSATEQMLIHGDLHHGNILRSEREPWLALDPKGVVGEPAWDAVYFSRSLLPKAGDPKRVLVRRLDQLAAELGLDRSRLVAWGLALSVLSGWWNLEDHGRGYEPDIACAEMFDELQR
ncbi:MAG: phosphotransferase [Anaerolineae bacterium]|nr:phosphotransferase [Anaerolineae bacterium]